MVASICFSMTKGESFVIGFSSSDFMIENLGKLSVDLKVVKEAISSSESGRCRLLFVCCDTRLGFDLRLRGGRGGGPCLL